MLRNFLLIAIRNLKRQLTYSFINIAGLAIGLACSLVIFLYVYGEWSYDRHFKNAANIYRVGVSFFNMGEFANAPELLTEYLPKQFDGVKAYTRLQRLREAEIRVDVQKFKEVVYFVDSSFFNVFDYEFIEGTPASAMQSPSSVVLTESMAQKFFKNESVIGKIIELGKERTPYVVSGIVEDPTANSHLKSSIWVSLDEKALPRKYWSSATVYTYVLLHEQFNEQDLRIALDQVIANQVYPQSVTGGINKTLEDYIQDENSLKFFIHPLTDIYLRSEAQFELSPVGNETNLYIFAVIASFILFLAAVNFINLSTARATRRAKEVGVRKTLGTSRGRLIFQFLTESVLTSVIALLAAFGLAELFALVFYWISGQPLVLSVWTNMASVFLVFGFTILVGLIAGVYPAFYLTSFKPVNVLKGNFQLSGSQGFRNVLVTFQFAISIGLIICSAVILGQLSFMSTKDLGFDQENVVTIDNIDRLKAKSFTFRDIVVNKPGVRNASLHSGEPASKAILAFYTYKTVGMKDPLTISTYFGDANYLDVMGFRLVQGRNFNKDLASDSSSVILNESAARALNLPLDPTGTVLNENLKVIGVVNDFHWESLRSTIAPLVIMLTNEDPKEIAFSQLAIKAENGKMSSVLSSLEREWKRLSPEEEFDYHFLDENFGVLLEKEQVLAKAISFFTILAIVISCLGLFGLAAYTTDQRTKEISIRKVLGASLSSIFILLNKQFTLLVIIAMMIAIPVSYYASSQWLSSFAYRMELSIWLFPLGGFVGLLLSYVTVGYHTLKASKLNPADTLKGE